MINGTLRSHKGYFPVWAAARHGLWGDDLPDRDWANYAKPSEMEWSALGMLSRFLGRTLRPCRSGLGRVACSVPRCEDECGRGCHPPLPWRIVQRNITAEMLGYVFAVTMQTRGEWREIDHL
jgi:hypothetical protein